MTTVGVKGLMLIYCCGLRPFSHYKLMSVTRLNRILLTTVEPCYTICLTGYISRSFIADVCQWPAICR